MAICTNYQIPIFVSNDYRKSYIYSDYSLSEQNVDAVFEKNKKNLTGSESVTGLAKKKNQIQDNSEKNWKKNFERSLRAMLRAYQRIAEAEAVPNTYQIRRPSVSNASQPVRIAALGNVPMQRSL
jgi:hypothetical protein